MATITVNVPKYQGDYELESGIPFTSLEWRWIKKISGYMPNTIEEGFEGDDPDLYIAFAIIAMVRARKVRPEQALMAAKDFDSADVDGSSIKIDFGTELEKEELAEEEQADVGEE